MSAALYLHNPLKKPFGSFNIPTHSSGTTSHKRHIISSQCFLFRRPLALDKEMLHIFHILFSFFSRFLRLALSARSNCLLPLFTCSVDLLTPLCVSKPSSPSVSPVFAMPPLPLPTSFTDPTLLPSPPSLLFSTSISLTSPSPLPSAISFPSAISLPSVIPLPSAIPVPPAIPLPSPPPLPSLWCC